jgi:uncharacterized protein YjbI with pentapeptide repeats
MLFYTPGLRLQWLGRTAKPCKMVFTALEKRQLFGQNFRDTTLDYVDFSAADLRDARFENVSLYGCDFSGADLRGAVFLACDLRRARFDHALLRDNSFKRSWLNGAEGVTHSLFNYLRACGGHFVYC